VVAVVTLAAVSALSFPALGGAEAPVPPEVRAAVLTPERTDGYVFESGTDSITVSTEPHNTGGNLRTVFWSSDAVAVPDSTSCATWSTESSDGLQQGAAVRISEHRGGGVSAVTVTKNVFPYGSWVFNVHVWDSATGRMDQLESFDLGATLSVPGSPPEPQPLPWRVCARTEGRRFSFKAWRVAAGEPRWGDARSGGSVELPADAPTSGVPGWYVGHVHPGMTATFSDLLVSPAPLPLPTPTAAPFDTPLATPTATPTITQGVPAR
jgi:hypothetical protein